MGIFSALSGKIYHFNSINTPIDNELAYRIRGLDDDAEKLVLAVAFDVAQQSILRIFHPDNGLHKKFIHSLSKDNLRNIWNIIIVFSIFTTLADEKSISREKLIKNITLVLGIDEHKLDLLFSFFENKDKGKQLMILWQVICNQIKPDLDNQDNFSKFTDFFVDIFNEKYEKIKSL